MSRRKCKSSSDVIGTAKKHQELKTQRKDEERQEEGVTAELKRFTRREMARGFCLSEEAALVSEAQDLDMEWYMKVVAAVQNAVRCYRVIMMRKKSHYPDITGPFFKESRQN